MIACIIIYKKKRERYLWKLLGICCLVCNNEGCISEIRNFQIHLQEYDSNSAPGTNPCDDGKNKSL